jgi:hypothetical protein
LTTHADAVIGELHPHLMPPRWELAVGLDVEALDAEQVVAVLGHAVMGVEAPAADAAALGDDHPLGAGLGDYHLGGDRMGLVPDVDHRALAESAHAADQQLGVALDQPRPPGQVRVQALTDPVVQRQHVVLGRLDQP